MKTRSPRHIVLDVLSTLFRREWRQRVVRGRWLTLWMVIEPLVQIAAIGALYTAYGRTTVAGQEAHLFLGVAIFTFVAFRNLSTKPSDAILVSSGLLVYRQVHVLDLLISKWGAEAAGYMFLIVLGMGYMGLFEDSIEVRAGDLVLGFGVMFSLSFGITCILAWARRERPWITTYFRPIFFAMYITSGALHPVWDLPEWATDVLVFNPMVQVLELIRQSLLFRYDSPLPISRAYLIVWALGVLLLGLHLVVKHGEELRSR